MAVKSQKIPYVSLLTLLLLCTTWFLLSQVSLVRIPKFEKFLGPDGALAFLEDRSIDTRIEARGPLPAPAKIFYVDVDTRAISKLGNFPWNREIFALAINALFEHGKIKAAGMDFVFSNAGIPGMGREEAEKGTIKLGKSIHKNKNVVLASTYGTENRPMGEETSFPFVFEKNYGKRPVGPPELPAYPVVGPSWGHIGLIDTVGNDVRYLPIFAKTDQHSYYPVSLNLALIFWGLDTSAIEIGKNHLTVRAPDGSLKAKIPLLMGQLAEPNWFTAWEGPGTHHVSIYDVLACAQMLEDGTDEQKKDAAEFFTNFHNAIVLIGPVDPLLKDLSPMPLSGVNPVPRVSVHGNMLQTILSGRFMQRPPAWLNGLFIFGLGFAAASFSLVPARYSRVAKMSALLCVGLYTGGAFWLFNRYNIILPLVAPLGAVVSCTFAGALLQLGNEQNQKRRIKGMFGTYLSPALVEKMIDSGEEPQLGGIDAEITAFFSDVQGFSGFSELLTPPQLVALMNEYLTAMTDILIESGCYVDKYIGDAIVGIFNAPAPLENHALKACIATQLLHKRLGELRATWASEGDKWPSIVPRMQMRIGINSGFATVGNMGSNRRFNYTMMGDTVNLAARCESGSKSYGAYTMITGETMQAAQPAGDDCVFRFLDKIIVKGRKEPAEMYEVVCLRSDLTEEISRCIEIYAQGIEHYRGQRWDEAISRFELAATLEPNRPELNPDSPSTPSNVMLERALSLKANPPEANWNGVYKMQTK
jgi:adenylate cyclase